jgi:hypothetical protein
MRATAERISSLRSLTEEQFKRLDEIFWGNDQVHGARMASRALQPFYEQNGRQWPPAKARTPPGIAVGDGGAVF